MFICVCICSHGRWGALPDKAVYEIMVFISQQYFMNCTRAWHYRTSSNGNIFRVTGPLWRESTDCRWIPVTKANVTRSFDVFFDLRLNKQMSKQSRRRWFETPSRSLWRHRNDALAGRSQLSSWQCGYALQLMSQSDLVSPLLYFLQI